MLVPLAIINHFKPTRPVQVTLDELYPEGYHERDLALAPDPEKFPSAIFSCGSTACTSWPNGLPNMASIRSANRAQKGRAVDARTLRGQRRPRRDFSGDAQFAHRAQGAGLSRRPSAGQPRRARIKKTGARDRGQRAHRAVLLAGLGHGHRVLVCLHESGARKIIRPDEKSRRMADGKGNPLCRATGLQKYRKVEPSGWVFEYNNKWNPDVDDTAMVLLALRKIPTDNPRRRDECFQRGLKWMMTFQCKDGGWAAFDKDCTKNILEKVPFADHNAMLDPNAPTSPRAF
jgi:squalene-hopene/tetraprenyl-beta-curcumene cyclase